MSQGAASVADLRTTSRLGVKASAFLAVVLGLAILYGVGFAQPAAIHNAAHDTRHGLAFPCH